VDRGYFRHLVERDFFCLECYARGVKEGGAKQKYRWMRMQLEEFAWKCGISMSQVPPGSRSFWGALWEFLGGIH